MKSENYQQTANRHVQTDGKTNERMDTKGNWLKHNQNARIKTRKMTGFQFKIKRKRIPLK